MKIFRSFFDHIYRGWIKIGDILGLITSTLLLSFVYWIIIGVLAFLAFVLRRDFLNLRTKKKSYWRDAKKENIDHLDGLKLPF